jgi:hypothetical protein
MADGKDSVAALQATWRFGAMRNLSDLILFVEYEYDRPC